MSNGHPPLKFSQDYEVLRPAPSRAYVIPEEEWNRLVGRLKRCGSSAPFFQSAGWFLLGIASSAFFGAQALPPTTSVDTVVTLRVAFWVGLIAGGVSLFFSHKHEQDRAELRKLIIEDMQALAKRYGPSSERPGSAAEMGGTAPATPAAT